MTAGDVVSASMFFSEGEKVADDKAHPFLDRARLSSYCFPGSIEEGVRKVEADNVVTEPREGDRLCPLSATGIKDLEAPLVRQVGSELPMDEFLTDGVAHQPKAR